MNKKLLKPKMVIILSVLLVLSIAIGITLALFIKNTERRANSFTFGNLSIRLTEPTWDALQSEDKITYPGREIEKDPQVTNTGKTDAYMYIKVQIPRSSVQTVDDDNITVNASAAQDLFTYKVNNGWKLVEPGEVSADGKYSVYVYAYTAAIVKHGETTPPLFDKVSFVSALEGQPEMGTVLEIPVQAIGIQSEFLNESGNNLEEKILNAYDISQQQLS